MAKQVAVTGSTGFLGQAVLRALAHEHYRVFEFPALNLLNERATETMLATLGQATPVIHLAYPGGDGIGDAILHPATIALHLLRMDLNVIQACARQHIQKLVCIGSVCAYPEFTPVPTCEDVLWSGYPERVNASYGIVKRTQLALLQACRQEFQLNGIHLMLPNLYGPGDKTAHVIPALIRKIRAAQRFQTAWTVWGNPRVTRSFLYIDDAAAGIVRALERYNNRAPLNLVQAGETSMRELVGMLEDLFEYPNMASFDNTQPAGHRRRNFSQVNMTLALDWAPQVSFAAGLGKTVEWYLANEPEPTEPPHAGT